MACQSLGLEVLVLMVVALGLPAMPHRWGLRVEHKCNNSN
jgi:hypothetical protein